MNILFQVFILGMEYGRLQNFMGKVGRFIIWMLVFIGVVLFIRAWLLDYRCKKINENRESDADNRE